MAVSTSWSYLSQCQVALVSEGSVDQLGRVALVLVRVAETSAAHLDDGAPALHVIPQLLLPNPVVRRLGPVPREIRQENEGKGAHTPEREDTRLRVDRIGHIHTIARSKWVLLRR